MVQCDLTKKKDTDKVIRDSNIIIQAAATTSGAKDILAKPYIHVNDNAIINSMVTRSDYYYYVKHVIVFSCSLMYQSSKKPLKESDFNPSDKIYPNYYEEHDQLQQHQADHLLALLIKLPGHLYL